MDVFFIVEKAELEALKAQLETSNSAWMIDNQNLEGQVTQLQGDLENKISECDGMIAQYHTHRIRYYLT
jgi:hypothetical protein